MTETLTVPTLRTERLVLRPPRPADAGPIGHYCADPRLARMTAAIPHPYPPGAAEAWLENVAGGRVPEEVWVIDASPTQWSETVGVIIFRPREAEIGYWVGAPFWNTGFASEAVERLVAHLFEDRKLDRVRAEVMKDNDASLRVLEKTGFKEVEAKALYSVARQQTVPGAVMALDRTDWIAARDGR